MMRRRDTQTKTVTPSRRDTQADQFNHEAGAHNHALASQTPSVALYGHYFRSSGFLKDNQEKWMDAVQVKPGFWKIRIINSDITRHSDEGLERHTTDIITLEHSYALFDALKKVYEFELSNLREDHGVDILDRPETLQDRHYIAFGEREGIAFDVNGRPLLTINGEIVETAAVNYEDMQRVREAWANKNISSMPNENDMLPNFPYSLDADMFTSLMVFQDMNNIIGTIEDSFLELFRAFDEMIQAGGKTSGFLSAVNKTSTAIKAFENNDESLNAKTPELAELQGKLNQYLLVVELYGDLFAAKAEFEKSFKSGNSSQTINTQVLKSARAVQNKYVSLGCPVVPLEDIQADIIRTIPKHGHPLELRPEAFRIIQKTLKDVKDNVAKEREKYRKASLLRKEKQTGRQPLASQIANLTGPRPKY